MAVASNGGALTNELPNRGISLPDQVGLGRPSSSGQRLLLLPTHVLWRVRSAKLEPLKHILLYYRQCCMTMHQPCPRSRRC